MYKKLFKRILDFLFAFFMLLALFPVIVIVFIGSLIFHKENPFFIQKRPGLGEKVFKILKFKSMNNKKDDQGNLLSDSERLTKWGSFLRKSSLDEIPQLFNVLKGDMSLVGPRPLMVKYLPYYTKSEKIRHTVRPGITGLAQINGRNNLSWDDKLKYDQEYVKNLSFKKDFEILINTFVNTVSSKDVVIDSYTVEPDLDEIRKNII